MAFPRTPGGLFPLTTAPTGNNAGGLYPTTDRLVAAIRSLAPTAYWKMDEASGNLADAMSGGYTATVTGSPTYGVAASYVGRGITWGTAYASAGTSVPVPTASMSVSVLFRTTDAAASIRRFAGRGVAGQASWDIVLSAGHAPVFTAYEQAGTQHAATFAGSNAAVNDGNWHFILGTFDGTTIRGYRMSAAGVVTSDSSTSKTGTWYKASTEALVLNARGTFGPFPGTSAHIAYWRDRVVTDAEFRWLGSIAFGG